jgi:hypothetical protein
MEDTSQLYTSNPVSTFFDPLTWYVADAVMYGLGYCNGYEYSYDDHSGDGGNYGYAMYLDGGSSGIGCGTSGLYGSLIGCCWGDGDGYGSGGKAAGYRHHYYNQGYDPPHF